MSDEDIRLDPAFRQRLRSALVRAVREERPRPRASGVRASLGIAAVLGLVLVLVVGGGSGVSVLPPQEGADALRAAAMPRLDVVCAGERPVIANPAADAAESAAGQGRVWGITITVELQDGAAASDVMIEECARLWRSGAIPVPALLVEFQLSTPESAGPQSTVAPGSVTDGGALSAPRGGGATPRPLPPLALCALDGGTPIVVPGVDCATAGLDQWQEERPR